MDITVYCSSSGALEPHFADGARTVGSALAAAGLTMVYGGGSAGLMGECARAAKAGGGRVIGIITGKLDALEYGWRGCDELQIVVDAAEFAVPALLSHEAPPHDPSRFLFLPEDVKREKSDALSLAS